MVVLHRPFCAQKVLDLFIIVCQFLRLFVEVAVVVAVAAVRLFLWQDSSKQAVGWQELQISMIRFAGSSCL